MNSNANRGGAPAAFPEDETDRAVLVRVAAGDVEIFGVIIRRYVRAVTLLAEQIVGDRDDAEDVAQEVLLIVLDQAAIFDASRSEFKTWLYAITRSVARRHNIRRQRRKLLWERWRPEQRTDPGPARQIEAREMLGRVARALQDLPPMQQQCFELHVVRGLEVGEVAAMHGISEATVRQHVFRARRVIREQLGIMEDV